jgi:hypothetical protein
MLLRSFRLPKFRVQVESYLSVEEGDWDNVGKEGWQVRML